MLDDLKNNSGNDIKYHAQKMRCFNKYELSFTGDNYINLIQREMVTKRDSIGGVILLQNCS